MTVNPEDVAKAALREYQESVGMTFADPDAPVAPDAKSLAHAADEEVGAPWMGGPR